MNDHGRAASALRSVEAAALAGLGHAALFLVARGLLLRAPAPDDPAVGQWYASVANQRSMITALNLVAIGCIAFLWFVAVIRRRVGLRENRFFGTVFLGSALLTAAIWLTGTLLFTAPAMDAFRFGTLQTTQSVSGWQAAGFAALTIVAIRVEAVFIISATTVARLSDAFPRVVVIGGYVTGLVLLFAPLPSEALALIFPVWEVSVSCALLVRRRQFENALGEQIEEPTADA